MSMNTSICFLPDTAARTFAASFCRCRIDVDPGLDAGGQSHQPAHISVGELVFIRLPQLPVRHFECRAARAPFSTLPHIDERSAFARNLVRLESRQFVACAAQRTPEDGTSHLCELQRAVRK